MQSNAYFYCMSNPDWDYENKVKYGFTSNYQQRIIDSHEQHSKSSQYVFIYELEYTDKYQLYREFDKIVSIISRDLRKISAVEQHYHCTLDNLRMLNAVNDIECIINKELTYEGGWEFLSTNAIPLLKKIIEEDLQKIGLNVVKRFCDEEIENIHKNTRKMLCESMNVDNFYQLFHFITLNPEVAEVAEVTEESIIIQIEPKEYQKEVIDRIEEFYQLQQIGKILWSCGLGKSLLSIFIIRQMRFNKILIGVPSLYLQNQMKAEILRIYPNEANIFSVGGNSTSNKIAKMRDFMLRETQPLFIITTYLSSYYVREMCDQHNITFDFKIGDEAHHLVSFEKIPDDADADVGEPEKIIRSYRQFHNISANKILYMTATEKTIEGEIGDSSKKIYSMDNEDIFGKIIDEKSVKWAIENHKITDYHVLLLKNTKEQILEIMNDLDLDPNHYDLFISAYMTLKSLDQYKDNREKLTHVLIYTNTTANSTLVRRFIDDLIDRGDVVNISREDIYNNDIFSNRKDINIVDEINEFKRAKYGIISCVYMFGEGFDVPELNGVTFAENMQSDIRIVQYTLRANRLNRKDPNKISYIILPYIETMDQEEDERNFGRCITILRKLRNVDENIEQKIKVFTHKTENPDGDGEEDDADDAEGVEGQKIVKKLLGNFYITDVNELEKIKIRLRYSKCLFSLGLSDDEIEYRYIKEINRSMRYRSQKEYLDDEQTRRHPRYIVQPKIYFTSKGVWTNWYDYLGMDTSLYLQMKYEWVDFCRKIQVLNLEDYDRKVKEYPQLPEIPEDFYHKQFFTNILNEIGIFSVGRRRVC